jgi:acyl-CoA dehydrogenase
MRDDAHLEWPFFAAEHRALVPKLRAWAATHVHDAEYDDIDAACRELVGALGRDGWLRYCVPAADGGAFAGIDSRAVCLIRETLAARNALADFAFAMQGLGSAPIVLGGSPALREQYLPRVGAGTAIAAFALSERDAGSDVAIATTARREGDTYILDGEKTWISNAGIADFAVVFARTGEAPGSRGLSAFVVDADTPGCDVTERIDLLSPHPIGTLRLSGARVGADRRLGVGGDGFALAMRSLDIFRASVAAAAIGFARRALEATIARGRERSLFGKPLADFDLSRAAIAEMATGIDAAALLTYRAAWTRDVARESTTMEAAMAKLTATETAQRVVDRAVQFYGALGVSRGTIVERLYRDVRALRIYEGATEVQQLIIAREVLR